MYRTEESAAAVASKLSADAEFYASVRGSSMPAHTEALHEDSTAGLATSPIQAMELIGANESHDAMPTITITLTTILWPRTAR